MNKLYGLPGFFLLFLYYIPGISAVNPSTLIKVTPQNDPECVEYYSYQGDSYCSTNANITKPAADPNLKNIEKQHIIFDSRVWQAAWGQKTDTITTVEYVPAGDDVNRWNELVTSQFIPGIQNKVSVKQFSDGLLEKLKKYNPVISHIKTTPNEIIFEFQIHNPVNLRQDELQKISKGPDGIYVLHYAIKKANMDAKTRKTWLRNLEASKIK